ncbi:NAD-glutamate dehydrogenase [Aureimonas endophytica]|uniref:NAD-glutamate dehydrogenase n=1 Tax=Aureimonas endophytica TaxID=2027858 RepID=A0A916ZNQ4_9HYPH|nr:NAD-glutamate dehydrogenase [Aureimonas endophytica]GGE06518.1 NAD-glutamate dehydrogenase [Aureimonas endophytica]
MIESSEKAAILAAVESHLSDAAGRRLAPSLFARPPAEDLKAFPAEALAIAAARAAEALARHEAGAHVVDLDRPAGFARSDGTALALLTVVNDDMPFLFDSVTNEVGARGRPVAYVSHPIVDGPAGRRVSLIQIAFEPDPAPEADAALAEAVTRVLDQVAAAVGDFPAMTAKVRDAVEVLRHRAATLPPSEAGEIGEAVEFLEWLLAENFIFLGLRELDYAGEAEAEALVPREGSGLGILRDPSVRVLGRPGAPVQVTPEIRAFLTAPAPLIVTKANTRSTVHRRAYLDYIGVKLYDAAGAFRGELRVVGLFTSSAYTRSVLTIPYLRPKAEAVIRRFDLGRASHSGKALLAVLESYPRDDLFQIGLDRLEDFAGRILELGERPRVRVLPRIDKFDRFVSVLVFVPRERYDTRLAERIGFLLAERYEGHLSTYYPAFPEGELARIHFIIGRRGGRTPQPDLTALEADVATLARAWEDDFAKAVLAEGGEARLLDLAAGLPESYRDLTDPAEAVVDAARIMPLSEDGPLAIDFYRRPEDAETGLGLKIYHLGRAVPLSTRVPILENMGFSVVSERTFEIRRPDGATVHLHDMDLTRRRGGAIPLADGGEALETTFAHVFTGRIENDGLNALVLEAGLAVGEANILRAYSRYLRQTGISYGQDFIAEVLLRHPGIAADLWRAFAASFDPARAGAAEAGPDEGAGPDGHEDPLARIAAERGAGGPYRAILAALDAVDSLDDDRILRRLLNLVMATLRTNAFAVEGTSAAEGSEPGQVAPALAFKLDSGLVEGLPAPVPFREIFVFDARVEGVHLRFGRVARGGIRWSDRSQDYRTEILGLVKAQQVKNAVIVPVGAKGGFLPKRLPDPAGDRDAFAKAGRAAYVVFIASLLSVTDNISGSAVVPPPDVRRHDGDDPYFVVAADKGTATFSDTANAIAVSDGFWLDDAFASGGSAGYDHKAMGITARGAWEAVKRHFRELGRDGRAWDIQSEPFTAVGCGDMSGDVFGNGMLLSEETRLVAAFDHRDIFIDPAPDAVRSFAERRRLFALPRSSWADYDRALISPGGGVFSRREKLIRLSEEAAKAIGWDRRSGTPAEVINAILKAPVDLLFFGGIGTYIRASTETNLEVGDRANDAVRVTGREVRAKVVGEGANLGCTQRGRMEYARAGGRINTDAIDNSAGVNTSDVEVNIKIALKGAMDAGRLDRADRDTLLKSMTADVGQLVLANNYEQTLALSLEERRGTSALALQGRFMSLLEEAAVLDRGVEVLPGEAGLADLRASGRGLTRPELAVILAYAKISLFDQLVSGSLPDEPYLAGRLYAYFPAAMRQRFTAEIESHRLKREIVATGLANAMVNRLGPTSVTAIRDATGASFSDIGRAFVSAHDGFSAGGLYAAVDALDNRVAGEVQNGLYDRLGLFLQAATRWFVANGEPRERFAEAIAELAEVIAALKPKLLTLVSEPARQETEAERARLVEAGVPEGVAETLALLPLLALVPDIALVSRETSAPLDATVEAYFAVTDLFEIGRLEDALLRLKPTDYYEILALERAGAQIGLARRRLTVAALSRFGGEEKPVEAWARHRESVVARIRPQVTALAGSGETSVARLTVAAGLLSDLPG